MSWFSLYDDACTLYERQYSVVDSSVREMIGEMKWQYIASSYFSTFDVADCNSLNTNNEKHRMRVAHTGGETINRKKRIRRANISKKPK
jgi:hypothetical protein